VSTHSEPLNCRLYLITPPQIALAQFAEDLKRAFDGGDVVCLQLRLKNCSDDEVRRAAEKLMPVTHKYNAAFIINDRPDLAKSLDADGVHVGQDDRPYAEARQIVGPDKIVGVTCHNSRHLAMQAAEQGADYVAFGAFFPTLTKEAKSCADPELLTWWQEMFLIPCVAIGGITVDNCGALVRAGADFIAVSSGVWDYAAGPQAAVTAFNHQIAGNK